jgi:hypothetical protein
MFWGALALLFCLIGYRLKQFCLKRGALKTKFALLQDIGKMPLADAARIAFAALHHSYFGVSAARFGARPNDILLFYCFHIARLVPLYGKRIPSQVLEQLSYATVLDLRFSIGSGGVRASELIGNNVYVDLYIDKKSLRRAIEYLKFVAVEQAAA